VTEPIGATDVLRYAFSQAAGRDFVAPLGTEGRPLTTSFGSRPGSVATDPLFPLAWGTNDLLEDTPYPDACRAGDLAVSERIQHALVLAFGLQRREPSNLFNDHRACASVRSRFPVHAFVHTGERAWWLDVYRHAVLPVGPGGADQPFAEAQAIALAGRYTHLPSLYGRLRGPLVELEIGISLRSLCVALELLGLPAALHLPGPESGSLMELLALDPPGEWAAPLSVAIAPGRPLRAAPGRAPTGPVAASADDPTLDEVVAVNRAATAGCPPAVTTGTATAVPGGLAPAMPGGVGVGTRSWSEVLWQRSAGRMPRLLAGVSGRRRPVEAAVVTDAVAWLDVAPPTSLLQEVARHIDVAACIQDAAGYPTGWYRLDRPGGLRLVTANPALPGRLEACYGHGLAPEVGCAVRHATAVWLFSADLRRLVDAFGPGGWTLAQYVCGWMAHGLCLAAAAHGLYARPNRAFDEILLHPVVGTRPGEIVLLSVVSGAGRFCEPMLDLRT
jgi:hypothetical protein